MSLESEWLSSRLKLCHLTSSSNEDQRAPGDGQNSGHVYLTTQPGVTPTYNRTSVLNTLNAYTQGLSQALGMASEEQGVETDNIPLQSTEPVHSLISSYADYMTTDIMSVIKRQLEPTASRDAALDLSQPLPDCQSTSIGGTGVMHKEGDLHVSPMELDAGTTPSTDDNGFLGLATKLSSIIIQEAHEELNKGLTVSQGSSSQCTISTLSEERKISGIQSVAEEFASKLIQELDSICMEELRDTIMTLTSRALLEMDGSTMDHESCTSGRFSEEAGYINSVRSPDTPMPCCTKNCCGRNQHYQFPSPVAHASPLSEVENQYRFFNSFLREYGTGGSITTRQHQEPSCFSAPAKSVFSSKSSLDYPDAPPPTPLVPEKGKSRSSFSRKLKGGLAKEFLPSPPPPTPKEDSTSSPRKEQDTGDKAEFMAKLMRSLSLEYSEREREAEQSIGQAKEDGRSRRHSSENQGFQQISVYANQLALSLMGWSANEKLLKDPNVETGDSCVDSTSTKGNLVSIQEQSQMQSVAPIRMTHSPLSPVSVYAERMSQEIRGEVLAIQRKMLLETKVPRKAKAAATTTNGIQPHCEANLSHMAERLAEELIQASFQMLGTPTKAGRSRVSGQAEAGEQLSRTVPHPDRHVMFSQQSVVFDGGDKEMPDSSVEKVSTNPPAPGKCCVPYTWETNIKFGAFQNADLTQFAGLLIKDVLQEAVKQLKETPFDNVKDQCPFRPTMVEEIAEKLSRKILACTIPSVVEQEHHQLHRNLYEREGASAVTISQHTGRKVNGGCTQSHQPEVIDFEMMNWHGSYAEDLAKAVLKASLDEAGKYCSDFCKSPILKPGAGTKNPTTFRSTHVNSGEESGFPNGGALQAYQHTDPEGAFSASGKPGLRPVVAQLDAHCDITTQQLEGVLQWAVASQLNIPVLQCRTPAEDLRTQFSGLARRAVEGGWTVGDLVTALLRYCDLTEQAAARGHSTQSSLLDWL
ncbi:hypothetical protein AOXY_G16649 [Acipenser oxyrinchus oxyrinchus]|uniref:A-kinase anchor 110kDa C-terminal domain-containing protein n=1 Tax=Acipenser oxyrinchus oxyrinchus TaxID=40147 RepID=A0AAD8D6T5_ACIOX|nr:hypothetical protein AOXY_G16649 [Acipenser oxyrinchus oxyrinchus]